MAQVYEVQYKIDVQSKDAEVAIARFQEAAQKMDQLQARFKSITEGLGKVNAAFKQFESKSLVLKVDTNSAKQKLDAVMKKLTTIKNQRNIGKLVLDTQGVTNALTSAQNQITAVKGEMATIFTGKNKDGKSSRTIGVGIDKQSAEQSLAKLRTDIEAIAKLGTPLFSADIDITRAEEKLAQMQSKIMSVRESASSVLLGATTPKGTDKTTQAISNTTKEANKAQGAINRIKNSWKELGDKMPINRVKQQDFFQSTEQATRFAKSLKTINKLIPEINGKELKPTVLIDNAIKSLNTLLKKIEEVKGQANITIKTSAAGASAAVGQATQTGGGINPAASAAGAIAGTTIRNSNSDISVKQPTNNRRWRKFKNAVLGSTFSSGTNIVSDMAKGMGVAYGFTMATSAISNAFKSATEYENISQTTKNILGVNDNGKNFEGRFDSMNKLVRQVGVETKFTAPQVASAAKYLAMAGLNVNDIQGAIRPISNLALIGDMDLGETADLTTNIMTGYGISANRMNEVADVLTKTFTKSNVTLGELAESFKYVGTVAKQSGVDFETASAAIGILGDAGIKASSAGTTLRTMLINMQKPNKNQKEAWNALGLSPKDSNGNIKNLNQLMTELSQVRDKIGNAAFAENFYKAFRITASTGALALVNGSQKFQEVTNLNKNESNGIAEQLADAKKNTIQGLWYQLTSAFTESGMQSFEQLQDAIRDFLKRMIVIMKSPEFAQALHSAMEVFLKIAESITDVFSKIVKFWNWLPDWSKTGLVYFAKFQMMFGIISNLAKTLASPFVKIFQIVSKISSAANLFGIGGIWGGIAGVGFAGVATALIALIYHIHEYYSAVDAATESTNKWIESYEKLGVDKLNSADEDSLIIGNMRIFNKESITYHEKLQRSIDLWRELNKEKNGGKKDEDGSTPFVDTNSDNAKNFKSLLGLIKFWHFDDKNFRNIFYTFVKDKRPGWDFLYETTTPGTYSNVTNLKLNGMKYSNGGSGIGENMAIQIALAQLGASRDLPLYREAESYYYNNITQAQNYQDYLDILNIARKKFTLKGINPQFDNLTVGQVNEMSFDDIMHTRQFLIEYNRNIKELNSIYGDFGKLLKTYDDGNNIDPKQVQKFLSKRFAFIFDMERGLYGSSTYINSIKDIVKNYKANGFNRAQEAIDMVTDQFNQFIGFYNLLNDHYKPIFAAFANMSPLMSGLPKGKFTSDGGYVGPTGKDQTTVIDGVKYHSKVLGPMGWQWVDKNDKPYVPKNITQTDKPDLNSLIGGSGGTNNTNKNYHVGNDQSQYKSHYDNLSAAPKQVIVRIENLMRVDKQTIDMNDGRQVAAVNNIKQELATALLDVVQDFNANII